MIVIVLQEVFVVPPAFVLLKLDIIKTVMLVDVGTLMVDLVHKSANVQVIVHRLQVHPLRIAASVMVPTYSVIQTARHIQMQLLRLGPFVVIKDIRMSSKVNQVEAMQYVVLIG